MRILLNKPMVLATGLTLAQASEAVRMASATKAGEYITFSFLEIGTTRKYELLGHCNEITSLFVANANDFVIEI